METVEWRQKDENVIIFLKTQGKEKEIKLDSKLINFILAQTPRILFFYLYESGQKYSFMADFKGLKPIIRSQSKLKITLKTANTVNETIQKPDKYYVIARGESYQDRYLSPQGWQVQEYPYSLEVSDKKVEETIKQTTNIQSEQWEETKGTLSKTTAPDSKICPNCKKRIPIELDTCPLCFTNFTKPEKGVDFVL